VSFDQVRLPKHALLDKFATIDEAGNYVQKGDERMRIEVIGQRLMTGRLAIAEAALVAARVLTMRTEAYAQDKVCNGLAGERRSAPSDRPRERTHALPLLCSRAVLTCRAHVPCSHPPPEQPGEHAAAGGRLRGVVR
jgi:hypothetical protein